MNPPSALQWQNVGKNAPQWRYWNPQPPGEQTWQPLNLPIRSQVKAQVWHTLKLEGKITGDQVSYQRVTLDRQAYP